MADINQISGSLTGLGQSIMAASQNARDIGTARDKAAFDKLNNPLLLKANTAAATTAENTAATGTNNLNTQNSQIKNIDQLNASNDAATPETLGLAGPFQNLDSIKAALRIRNEMAKTNPQVVPMQLRDYILQLQNVSQDAALDTRKKSADAIIAENTAKFGPQMSQADLDNKTDTNNNLVTTGKTILPLANATIAKQADGKFTTTTVDGKVTPFDTHAGKFGVPGGLAPVKNGGTNKALSPEMIRDQSAQAVTLIKKMLAPGSGLDETVGAQWRRPGSLAGRTGASPLPGSMAAVFANDHNQLKSIVGRSAVPEFRGLGRLTNLDMNTFKDAGSGVDLDITPQAYRDKLKVLLPMYEAAAAGDPSALGPGDLSPGNVSAGIAAPNPGTIQKWGRDAQGNPVPIP